MRDFCYYEPWEVNGQDMLYKVLIVTDDNDVMVEKYNLTLIGDESINSYEELKQKFGEKLKRRTEYDRQREIRCSRC